MKFIYLHCGEETKARTGFEPMTSAIPMWHIRELHLAY